MRSMWSHAAVAALVTMAAPAVAALAASPPALEPPAVAAPPPAAKPEGIPNIEGRYSPLGNTQDVVEIARLRGTFHRVTIPGRWEGVGIFDGKTYWGVFRYPQETRDDSLVGAMGTHKCTLSSDGVLVVRGEFTSGRSGGFDETWVRVSAPTRGGEPNFTREPPVLPPRREPAPPPPGQLAPPPRGEPAPRLTPEKGKRPKVDEYVYVEELPEVAHKVSPSYPEEARKKRIQGTVLVQALVLEDGRVADCFVQKSLPGLDEAAIAAVRQWLFKPALTKGKPVAVWVAVPVRFTLH